METLWILLVAVSSLIWIGFALLPWGLWRHREVLEAVDPSKNDEPLAEITVMIPARNESEVIRQTVLSVTAQGPELKLLLIDDGSEDGTAAMARAVAGSNFSILQSAPLPEDWSGKLWALEQGRQRVTSRYVLFLDADIKLASGIIKSLREKMRQEDAQFISLMAVPSMTSSWEKLLMPAFVYFFNALYPFRRVNSPNSNLAAAAGGCILMETRVLEKIGGFASIKSAVIDDCAFARRVKLHGFKIWLGLTHSVESVRGYKNLMEIGDMIARSAFAQLYYSLGLLLLCSFILLLLYILPSFMAGSSNAVIRYLSFIALGTMILTYLPTLRFYRQSWAWALCLPVTAMFFLAMTWTSAIRYWRGERTRWKGRSYRRPAGATATERPLR